jgi:tetratricopeptide (TPR) repeat protein
MLSRTLIQIIPYSILRDFMALTNEHLPSTLPSHLYSRQRIGWAALLFAAVFAFLLASFPARNSDVWVHLAAGRSLAHGEYASAEAARSSPGLRGNLTPIYDLVVYGVYSLGGGFALVFGKALAVGAIGLILVLLSRAGSGWWTATVCTALALLAMGARLLLQPAILSCLFLALTFWFVRRRPDASAVQRSSFLPPWPLALLFLIWVNVDGWFILGLGTVAFVWLGEILDYAGGETRRQGDKEIGEGVLSFSLRRLVSLALLTAVCLFNASGVYAFAAAPGLMGWSGAQAAGQVASPFQKDYFAAVGVNAASLAYFPLLGLSLLSFLLNLPRWNWRRFLPWLGLALVSAVQARAVPFFAVAAGPALAWNLQEFLVRHPLRIRPRERIALSFLASLLFIGVLVSAWPGWLQLPPYEPRRWAVELPPSVARGATTIRSWRDDKKLGPDARGLHLSAETANAFAWFCPEEKAALDGGLASAILADQEGKEEWTQRPRVAGANHLIVYDSDHGRLSSILDPLLADPVQWPLLYAEGDLAVFGWRDPDATGKADPFWKLELNLNQLAFDPAPDKKAPPRPSAVKPEAPPFWDAFWKPAPPRPIDQEEANLRLFHADALLRSAGPRQTAQAGWEASQTAALIGAAGGWAGPVDLFDARVRLTMVLTPPARPDYDRNAIPVPERWAVAYQWQYALQQDDTPPALLYLAIRAARRALAVNPDNAQAYEVLGESYLRMIRNTRERAWGARMPQLVQLRRVQASAALNQAISLKPRFAKAHFSLGDLYQEMGCRDLAVEQLRIYVKLIHEAGPEKGVGAAEFRQDESQLHAELSRLSKELDEQETSYTLASSGLSVVDRAFLAFDKGLIGKARDLLLESDVSAFGTRGMELELKLLLQTGRARNVAEWTNSVPEARLGAPTYHWLRAQAFAALGNYAQAGEEFARLAPSWQLDDPNAEHTREALAVLVARRVVEELPIGAPYQLRWPFGRAEYAEGLIALAEEMQKQADILVLRGLVALEEGEATDAGDDFHVALELWGDESKGGGLDFAGRVVAQECMNWLGRKN